MSLCHASEVVEVNVGSLTISYSKLNDTEYMFAIGDGNNFVEETITLTMDSLLKTDMIKFADDLEKFLKPLGIFKRDKYFTTTRSISASEDIGFMITRHSLAIIGNHEDILLIIKQNKVTLTSVLAENLHTHYTNVDELLEAIFEYLPNINK